MNKWIARIYHTWAKAVLCMAPGSSFANRIVSLPRFWKQHARFPRKLVSHRATFEDYIFDRKIGAWSPFHETCVDKEYAKLIATALCPDVRTPETAAVLPISSGTTLAEVMRFLAPFSEGNYVAKPTHSSGRVLFLKPEHMREARGEVAEFFAFSRQNYFFINFETQYRRLQRKILVEQHLGREADADYRFFSAHGKVIFCQYDYDRFADRRQALFTVPDHKHIPIKNRHPLPDPLPGKPAHWEEMLRAASMLSRPFDFVRVDLYDLPQGVFFSEFTFTPCNSNLAFDSPSFSRRLLENVLAESRIEQKA